MANMATGYVGVKWQMMPQFSIIWRMHFNDFHQIEWYRHHFMDLTFWEPVVQKVCAANNLGCKQVSAGLAGTFPTFKVDNRWVVKFFGRLFDGGAAFKAELAANQLVANHSHIPAAPLVGTGKLFSERDEWEWPYLIFKFLPGLSIGEHRQTVSFSGMQKLAKQMGVITQQLHLLPLNDNNYFFSGWEPFITFLEAQNESCVARHQEWGVLPTHLIAQIPEFMLSAAELVDTESLSHLIHADLTADHLLGVVQNGRFHPTGLIDFGDAMVGNILYELVALHLDLFHCDKRLLATFLTNYSLPQTLRVKFAIKAMCMTLLHRFNSIAGVVHHVTQPINEIKTLQELATMLWGVI